MRMQRRKKGQHEASANAAPIQAQFQSRPFQDNSFAPPEQQTASPEVQLQQERRGFDFAKIPLFDNSAASSQPIQRQEEDGDIQMKPEAHAIQRMGDENDEDIQMKPESNSAVNPLFKNLVQRETLQDTPAKIPIQTQLTVGAPGDKYEQEADQVAHNVVQQINSPTANAVPTSATVQRETAPEDDEVQMKPIIQRQELDGGVEASSELESSINQAKGSGQSLDAGLQRSMGQAMGADFSGVKVHTDSQADTLNQSLQAKAFTTGQHVFFKKGEYQPANQGGQELIAHELTHVVQQGGSQVQASTIQRKLIDDDKNILDEIQDKDTRKLKHKAFMEALQEGLKGAEELEGLNGIEASFIYDRFKVYEAAEEPYTASQLIEQIKNDVNGGDKDEKHWLGDLDLPSEDDRTEPETIAINLAKLCAVSVQGYNSFTTITQDLAQLGPGGTPKYRAFPGIKGLDRAAFKAVIKKGGEVKKLGDILASSIIYESLDDLCQGAKQVKQYLSEHEIPVVGFKNRFREDEMPGSAYRDMLINIKLPGSQHIAEVQLHMNKMIEKKDSVGHKYYKIERDLNENIEFVTEKKTKALKEDVDKLITLAKDNQVNVSQEILERTAIADIESRLKPNVERILRKKHTQNGLEANEQAKVKEWVSQGVALYGQRFSLDTIYEFIRRSKKSSSVKGYGVDLDEEIFKGKELVGTLQEQAKEHYNQAWEAEQGDSTESEWTALVQDVQSINFMDQQQDVQKNQDIDAQYNRVFGGDNLLNAHKTLYEEALINVQQWHQQKTEADEASIRRMSRHQRHRSRGATIALDDMKQKLAAHNAAHNAELAESDDSGKGTVSKVRFQ